MAKKKHRGTTKMDKLRKKDDQVATKKENEQYFPASASKTQNVEVTRVTKRRLKGGEERISIYETFMHKGLKGQHPLK